MTSTAPSKVVDSASLEQRAPILPSAEVKSSVEEDKEFIKFCYEQSKRGVIDPKSFEGAVKLAQRRLFYLNPLRFVLLLKYFTFCVNSSTSNMALPKDLLLQMESKILLNPEFLYIFSPYQLATLVSSFSQLKWSDRKIYEAVASRILNERRFLTKFNPSEMTILLTAFYASRNNNKELVGLFVERIEKDPSFFEELRSGGLTMVLKCARKAQLNYTSLMGMAIEKISTNRTFFNSFSANYLTSLLLNVFNHPSSAKIIHMAAEKVAQDQAFRDKFDVLHFSHILALFSKQGGEFATAFEAMANSLLSNENFFLSFEPKQLCSLLASYGKAQVTTPTVLFEKIVSSFTNNPGRLKRCDVIDLANLVYGLKALGINDEEFVALIKKYIDEDDNVKRSIGTVANFEIRDALLEFCTGY